MFTDEFLKNCQEPVRTCPAAMAQWTTLRGLTRQELATKCGCSVGLIDKAKAGKRPLKIATVLDLAEGLHASFEQLLAAGEVDRLLKLQQVAVSNPSARLTQTLTVGRPVNDFQGRTKELETILGDLRAGRLVNIHAVKSQGGMGKTTLAEKVAAEVADLFPTAIKLALSGTAPQPTTPAQAMTEVIRRFRPEVGQLPDSTAELRPLYLQLLAAHKPLVLLDNARDAAQVEELFRDRPAGVGFVITSRRQIVHDAVRTLELNELSPAEALTLLAGIVGQSADESKQLPEVAKLCGYLPLALRVAGTFLREKPTWTVERYVAALETERLARLKLGTADRDVEAVLSLSVTQLILDNPERAERFQMLSVFPTHFANDAAAAVWALDEDTAFEELDELLAVSLVQQADIAGRWELHDLMRPVARKAFEYVEPTHPLRGSGDDRIYAAEQRHAERSCKILKRASDLYLAGDVLGGLALYDQEQDHITAGFVWANRRRGADPTAMRLSRDYGEVGGYVLNLRLDPSALSIWFTRQLEACQSLGDRHGEGMALCSLGGVQAHIGNHCRAVEYYERALGVARAFGDPHGEGCALNGLGFTCAGLGDHSRAAAYHEQALASYCRAGDRRGEGIALGGLGNHWATLGQHHRAKELYEAQVGVAREIGDPHMEGCALGNIGLLWSALGERVQAITFFEQQLATAHRIGDSESIARASFSIGSALASLGVVARAIPFVEAALAYYRSIGHEEHTQMMGVALARCRAAIGG